MLIDKNSPEYKNNTIKLSKSKNESITKCMLY